MSIYSYMKNYREFINIFLDINLSAFELTLIPREIDIFSRVFVLKICMQSSEFSCIARTSLNVSSSWDRRGKFCLENFVQKILSVLKLEWFLMSHSTEKSSAKPCQIKLKLDYKHIFPIDLAPNKIASARSYSFQFRKKNPRVLSVSFRAIFPATETVSGSL